MNYNRQLIKSFFKSRSISGPSAALVNHQLGSFNDFLPHDKNSAPWMQRVVDNISVGADESLRGAIRLELGDLDVVVNLGKIRIGRPMVYEANGSQTDSIPMMARLRNMTYAAPINLNFTGTGGIIEGNLGTAYVNVNLDSTVEFSGDDYITIPSASSTPIFSI